MKKRFTIIMLFIIAFSVTGMAFALARIKPELADNSRNEPMHLEFEQNPEQNLSVNCNWHPNCPVIPPDPCLWLKNLHKEEVIHV